MRIASSTFVVMLATIFAFAAAQEDWSGLEDYENSFDPDASLEIRTAEYIEDEASVTVATTPTRRCDLGFLTRVNTVQKKGIAPESALLGADGCGNGWLGELQGTLRVKGSTHPDAFCDSLKTTFEGTAKRDNDTATLSSTVITSSEESRWAEARALDAKNRDTGYDSPSRSVSNRFFENLNPDAEVSTSLCSNGASLLSGDVTCTLDARSRRSNILGYSIENPTDQTYKGLNVTVTFANQIVVRKMFRPKSCPRIALPSIGTSKDAPGALVNVKTLTMPTVRKTIPPKARMEGVYLWTNGRVVATGQANLTIMSGKNVICTATTTFI